MVNIESDSKERMDKRLERMHKIESSWDHEIINQDKCQTCKFHLDAFPNGSPCWKCLEGSPPTVSGKYYKRWIPSNADCIRRMSIHELAEFLSWVAREGMNGAVCSKGVWTKAEIAGGIIIPWDKWLEEEYKE